MRIGADIPRYSLEALPGVSLAYSAKGRVRSSVPFISDNLLEAVGHAIVGFLTNLLASL